MEKKGIKRPVSCDVNPQFRRFCRWDSSYLRVSQRTTILFQEIRIKSKKMYFWGVNKCTLFLLLLCFQVLYGISINRMTSIGRFWFLKSRLYPKWILFNEKFNFCHKILYLKLRLYVKSKFVKLRIFCIFKSKNKFIISKKKRFKSDWLELFHFQAAKNMQKLCLAFLALVFGSGLWALAGNFMPEGVFNKIPRHILFSNWLFPLTVNFP